MAAQRIVLFDSSSQLLNELFKRVIEKQPGLELIEEVEDMEELSAAIEKNETDWVVHLESSGEQGSQATRLLAGAHPATRFLAIAVQDRQIRMSRIQVLEEELNKEISLIDLISIIEGISPDRYTIRET